MVNNYRVSRILKNTDRQERLEQKLGISETMTKLKDEKALRSAERREWELLREKQQQDREKMRNRDRRR